MEHINNYVWTKCKISDLVMRLNDLAHVVDITMTDMRSDDQFLKYLQIVERTTEGVMAEIYRRNGVNPQ
jgi:hypothetical protein